MRVAVAFCYQTKDQCRENESGYSLFSRSEAEFLPHLLERETPILFNHK
jgi:hypothetical protein